jgi:cytoskeletal protein CcmA (bactofilin family)
MRSDELHEPPVGTGKPRENAADAGLGPAAAAAMEVSPEEWVQERTRVAVGKGVNVSGKLRFHEAVRIEGFLRGDVSSADLLVIAEEGVVEGRVRAPKLVVLGEFRGEIVGSGRVYLGPHARVFASVRAASLTIRAGAHFDGNVRMANAGAETQKPA